MAETDLRGGLKLREILAEVEKALAVRSQVAFDSPTHIVTGTR